MDTDGADTRGIGKLMSPINSEIVGVHRPLNLANARHELHMNN